LGGKAVTLVTSLCGGNFAMLFQVKGVFFPSEMNVWMFWRVDGYPLFYLPLFVMDEKNV
jgi:hypothetical protein